MLVDEGFTIPFASVKSFSITASINSSFPKGELVLNDSEGRFLSTLSIKPGNLISFAFVDEDAEKSTSAKSLSLFQVTMRVLNVLGGRESKGMMSTEEATTQQAKVGSLGGDVIVTLTDPWMTHTDYTNHAYKQKSSDIIRAVVANTKRNPVFKKISIDETDDSGLTVRYKIAQSEASFIHNKILPYATIERAATYCFVNEFGEFHLHNFKTMYSQDSKLRIIPPHEDTVTNDFRINSPKVQQKSLVDGAYNVGEEFLDQLATFKKIVYVEDSSIHTNYIATIPYSSAIPGYTLMRKDYINNVKATSATIYPFRLFEDVVRLEANNSGIMNEFFAVSVVVDLVIDVATVGATVDLVLAGQTVNDAHWMSGKWLIMNTDHFQKGGKYYSRLLLARPAVSDLPSDLGSGYLYKT